MVWTQPYGLEGEPPEAWAGRAADFRVVTSGYFQALGARLLAGRAFTAEEDLVEKGRVVVVDALMARRLAPQGGSVLGRRIAFPLDGRPVTAEIVGVVAHIRHEHLEQDGRESIYVPYRQEASRDVSLVVRTSGDPGSLPGVVRREVSALDPRLPAYQFRTMDDSSVRPWRPCASPSRSCQASAPWHWRWRASGCTACWPSRSGGARTNSGSGWHSEPGQGT